MYLYVFSMYDMPAQAFYIYYNGGGTFLLYKLSLSYFFMT